MAELAFIELIMMVVILAGAVAMLFIRTLPRAIMGIATLGAVLTALILYQTMDISPAGGGSLIAVALMIWPSACAVFFAAYLIGALARTLLRAVKPARDGRPPHEVSGSPA